MSDLSQGWNGQPSGSPMTKAQKYEDEKRRITTSCFSKVDADGSLLEQYITHCRVIEDAAYSSQPPPHDVPIDLKKARVILVSVRKSGRVKVHKARENANGTFSIGKTWNLDDLQQIENHPMPLDKAFTVTILKPYFWQASSLKEKEYFIQSLVKIYKKYTGGKVPALIGFDGTVVAQLAAEGGPPSITSTSSSVRSTPRETPPPPPINLPPPQIQTPPEQHKTPVGVANRSLKPQQSTPIIRAGENYISPPQSSLRSMQSANSLGTSPAIGNPSLAERRRPSDGSTRSAHSISNLRTDSPASARQTPQDDQRSIRTVGSAAEQPLPSEPIVPKPLASRAKEFPPLTVPPPARIITQMSPQTPILPPIPQDKEKETKPTKKKSSGDVANRFRIAATTYTAGSLLGKSKSPTSAIGTPRTPTFSPLSPDGLKGKGVSIKDKISGPILEPLPRNDTRISFSPTDNLSPSNLYLLERSDTDDFLKGTQKDGGVSDQEREAESPTIRQRKKLGRSILDDLDTSQMSLHVDQILNDFSWDWRGRVENLEADIRKELATVEAKNVLINPGGDERLGELSKLFDDAIEQCEALDGLLTLYAVELTSLTDDIAHIENQSQGLQVQTANQKTLQRELERILTTISISPTQLDTLKQGSLESNLGGIETALLVLYKAMLTIDPSMTTSAVSDLTISDEDNVGSIRALQERKEGYRLESKDFLRRFRPFMDIKFRAEIVSLQELIQKLDVVGQSGKSGVPITKPRLLGHDELYKNLYKFAGMILFAKEVDKEEFTELQKLYERPTKAIYQEELSHYIFAWKRISRKSLEEAELVFTVPEKEHERITTTVRTLTVKRSQTLAKTLRPSGSIDHFKDLSKKDPQEGRPYPFEAFSGALEEICRQVCKEQNFVIEFFHLHSQTNVPYEDFIQNGPPESRTMRDLGLRRTTDQDRIMGRMVLEYIGDVFSFLAKDLGNFVDWATKGDPLQGVGVLFALEKSIRLLDETNQEFLLKVLQKIHSRLTGHFSRFLDEQVRAIEDTKVKIKKRKAVIAFMKIFPQFAARIEDQLPPSTLETDVDSAQSLGIRGMVDRGYRMINKAMFESLQAIARESGFSTGAGLISTTAVVGGPGVPFGGADPEDKEQLNYHIMMIENMNHYVEDVDTRGNIVLGDFMRRAEVEYKEHLGMYLTAVVRRPLGRLLDFIESIESQLNSSSSLTMEDITTRASHSRHVLKKILSHYNSKDIKGGIGTLRKRVDKHFVEGDEQDTSRRLLAKMNRELMEEYMNVRERIENIIVGAGSAYQGLELEFSREDVVQGFTK